MAYSTKDKKNANARKRYKEDHARQRQIKNAYRERNIEHARKYLRDYMRKNRYGIEPSRPCPDNCESCKRPFGAPMSGSGPCFDHDHNTNIFRGWLCRRCNLILGSAQDDKTVLRALANYVETHELIS